MMFDKNNKIVILFTNQLFYARTAYPQCMANFNYYRDVYSLQSGPQQLEFGHVFEDPSVWEQRYEKKDFDTQRYQGKVSLMFFLRHKRELCAYVAILFSFNR